MLSTQLTSQKGGMLHSQTFARESVALTDEKAP
jgi:hypothetical protein